jgi:hypothetical protein
MKPGAPEMARLDGYLARACPRRHRLLDFNDDWPLDSWQVTEPDDGYQAKYIRLLSKFVQ